VAHIAEAQAGLEDVFIDLLEGRAPEAASP
jgi:hypothetical protein